MKNTISNINYDQLFQPTGETFVDAGCYALQELTDRYPDRDIMGLIMLVTNIYVDKWEAKINPFFLNSKITQPAFKPEKKKEETEAYFKSLIDGTAPHITGYCRITGVKTELYPAGRDNSVLSGSGTFVNFHHSFQSGIMLSKEAIIRYHFLPLACELLQGRIAVIHSNNPQITELYARDCCSRNLSAIGKNISDGILKSEAHSTGTAIFRFIDKILLKYTEEDIPNGSITLYHFTNFGASPDVQIYTLPFPAFIFYQRTQSGRFKDGWNKFVKQYYFNSDYKKVEHDDKDSLIIATDKKGKYQIEENEYKYWRNSLYDKLLMNRTIVPEIMKWSKEYKFDLDLLELYLINIRNMKKETINKINEIADFIISASDDSKMKKVLTELNGVKNAFLLRRFILKVINDHYSKNFDEPLVTVEDYVEYLFPDTSSWMETRDVLLISLYQKLHIKKIHFDIQLEENKESEDEY